MPVSQWIYNFVSDTIAWFVIATCMYLCYATVNVTNVTCCQWKLNHITGRWGFISNYYTSHYCLIRYFVDCLGGAGSGSQFKTTSAFGVPSLIPGSGQKFVSEFFFSYIFSVKKKKCLLVQYYVRPAQSVGYLCDRW